MKKLPEWIRVSMKYAKDVEKNEQLRSLIACRKKYIAQISRRSWDKLHFQLRFINLKLRYAHERRIDPRKNSVWNETGIAILQEQWNQVVEARLKKFDRETKKEMEKIEKEKQKKKKK